MTKALEPARTCMKTLPRSMYDTKKSEPTDKFAYNCDAIEEKVDMLIHIVAKVWHSYIYKILRAVHIHNVRKHAI